jgi:putative transposase
MNKRQPYPSDLTDEQWALVEPLIPPAKEGGRERTTDLHEVLNGVFYILVGGVSWRMMPHDLPKWKTVYHYFREWKRDGTWARMNDTLREKVRVAEGREATPSAGSIDSQSVKTSKKGAFEAGMEGKRSTDASGTLLSIRWAW